MSYNTKTIDYYNQNAAAFVQGTAGAEMSAIRDRFLRGIPDGGVILDLGCGSGRDSRAFMDAGYRVVMVDGSEALCRAAEKLTGQKVVLSLFQDYHPEEETAFDGIWACASLLHLESEEIRAVVKRLAGSLRGGGSFYMSFKYGRFTGERKGRFFTDFDEEKIQSLMEDIPRLMIIDQTITGDVRPGRSDEKWLNVICRKVQD